MKRLRQDETRSSSQSRQSGSEDSQRLFNAARSRGSRDHRNYRNHFRSSPDKPSTPRPSRPYAVGLAAQLSQRRKQLEARAKEKLKMEKENLVGSPAGDNEGTKVNSPSVKLETKKRKVVIEIHDDDEQNVTDCQKEASVDLSDSLPQTSEKIDDMSVKDDDDDDTSTADSSSSSSSDANTAQNDSSKCDAGQTSTTQQTSVDCSAAKSTSSTLSLMNLPMPPVDSDSDSEATPASTEELQL